MICENVLSLMKKVNNNLVKVDGTARLMKKAKLLKYIMNGRVAFFSDFIPFPEIVSVTMGCKFDEFFYFNFRY